MAQLMRSEGIYPHGDEVTSRLQAVKVAAALRLPMRAPFHLEATVRVLQRRPTNLIDTWDGDNYRRL
ncbi:MAG TPA: hypothetical protein VIC29_06905 [Steroidobacteraceae bacterium]|jgi:hypothetical protein